MPTLSTATVVVGVYMNTQLGFMLTKKDMFNIEQEKVGSVISNLTGYSIPFTMIALCFVSYAFELLGRRMTLFISFFLSSIFFAMIPRTAPSYSWLMTIRCLLAITMAAPMAHPLVADFVHVSSRGKMVVFCGVGIILGEIIAISVFKLQTMYKCDFYQSFD